MPRPFKIGLTGSIGMGKTETGKLFGRLGIPVYDADAAVHALYEKGGAAVAPIADAFPGAIVDGQVDRARLSTIVATDQDSFKRLEAIVHPLVARMREEFLDAAEQRGEPIVVLDIPLLFETKSQSQMDAVVVVSAPAAVQRARVLAREGMTEGKLDAIQARQVHDSEKRAKADFVIETDKGLSHAFEQVTRVVEQVKRRIGS